MSTIMLRTLYSVRSSANPSFTSQKSLLKNAFLCHANGHTNVLHGTTEACIQAQCSQIRSYFKDVVGVSYSFSDSNNATFVWNDGKTSKFHSKWLRFNCRCPVCVDSDTNQGRIAVEKVPTQITLRDVKVLDNSTVEVAWNEDPHRGRFTTDFLQEYCYSEERTNEIKNQSKLNFSNDLTVPRISWTDVENSDEKLYEWLRHINAHGLCLLTNVPTENYYLKKVIMKIGYPTRALYGEIFDVYTRKEATNLAYSNEPLQFHMDHAWYESPTGVQFLHCLRFDDSIIGGNTRFVDMYHVVDEFRKKYPEEFNTLCTVPCTFWRIHDKREDPVHFIHRRPMISVNREGEVISISWHAHATGPPLVNEDNVDDFYTAFQLFAKEIEGFSYIREIRLQEGEVIAFNNRRLAHGRSAMENSNGMRHLQGGYVDINDFKSKLLVLSKKYGASPAYLVGNSDWI